VIPARAYLRVDCRVPPEEGEEAAREAVEQIVGTDGYELTFEERVMGSRSPVDTPLMDFIRSFVEQEDPGALVVPSGLQGFSDSHWWRQAFPGCVVYGFLPARAFDVFEATPLVHGADERVPVEDLRLGARFFAKLVTEMLGA
jgi:acetylornithine deacetylase/succinyl-diaminopimelate desuccinylase-like protein